MQACTGTAARFTRVARRQVEKNDLPDVFKAWLPQVSKQPRDMCVDHATATKAMAPVAGRPSDFDFQVATAGGQLVRKAVVTVASSCRKPDL